MFIPTQSNSIISLRSLSAQSTMAKAVAYEHSYHSLGPTACRYLKLSLKGKHDGKKIHQMTSYITSSRTDFSEKISKVSLPRQDSLSHVRLQEVEAKLVRHLFMSIMVTVMFYYGHILFQTI